jgi:hypothetical protein
VHVFTEPKKAAEYRRNATICMTMAREASEGDRAVLLEIADDWTAMAVECETQNEAKVPSRREAEIVPFPRS